MPKYKTLSLTNEVYEHVEKTIKEHPEWGYTSVTDFVRAALRKKLAQLEREGEL